MSDDLKRGSLKNQIRSRHGEFAERLATAASSQGRFDHLAESDRKAIAEAVRLAVLDGALAELETQS